MGLLAINAAVFVNIPLRLANLSLGTSVRRKRKGSGDKSDSLTTACLRHQNVGVTGRLIAIVIAIAVAVLALAEIRQHAQVPTAQGQSSAAATRLADSPAPAPKGAAVITAAVNPSATVQTVAIVDSRRQLNRAVPVSTISTPLIAVKFSAGKPRSFPLLI